VSCWCIVKGLGKGRRDQGKERHNEGKMNHHRGKVDRGKEQNFKIF